MGFLANLNREARERADAGETWPHPAAVAASAAVLESEEGQAYRDAFNPPGFVWVVGHVDEDVVSLLLTRDGEATESYLTWPRNRWRELAERQGLELVSAGD